MFDYYKRSYKQHEINIEKFISSENKSFFLFLLGNHVGNLIYQFVS